MAAYKEWKEEKQPTGKQGSVKLLYQRKVSMPTSLAEMKPVCG